MKLGDWLHERSMTLADFAAVIGVDESSISRYVNGRLPRKEILSKIMTATDQRVTANDWLMPSDVVDDVNGPSPANRPAA